MASIDLESVVQDWIDYDAQYNLPCVCVDLYPEPYHCECSDDLGRCFIEYLYDRNFEEALEENPSAITRLDAHFDVFAEDYLMPAGD